MWSEFWTRRSSGRDGVVRAVRATICIAAGAAAALSPAASLAREPGTGDTFAPGSTVNLPVGELPPGVSMTNYFTYFAGSVVDAHGNKTGTDISFEAYTLQVFWNPNLKILGANYGAYILQPLVDLQLDNKSNLHLPALGKATDFAAANTLITPVNLSWTLAPHLYFSTGAGFYAPTGDYKSPSNNLAVYTGANFWTFQPEMGLSYFKPGPDGYNLSLHALYNINSENEDTKYRSGDQLFLNWTATKSFSGFTAGFVGYYTKQTTADTDYGHAYQPPIPGLPLIDVTSKPERLGLGATVGGKIGPAIWDLSYMKDVHAVSDVKGDTVLLHVRFIDMLADGKQPLPPLK